MKIFVQTKKLGPFFYPFLVENLAIWHQVFGCFLENRLSEFHVTWSETRDNCFQSFNGSAGSGKTLFWPFWPIFGQKYIACGDKLRFLTILFYIPTLSVLLFYVS